MVRTLSPTAARRVYDRIGRAQDLQAFVEDRATAEILVHADLPAARAVFELGCGTGRFADVLLTRHLRDDATYRGVDVSPVMIELARSRLVRFGARASVRLTEGGVPADEASACDRFLSNFVLDLLPEDEIARVLADAHRMLRPRGLLGVCSLTTASSLPSRAFVALWTRIHAFNPALVGGCRPLDLLRFLPSAHWRVIHHARVTRLAVPLEAVVAERV